MDLQSDALPPELSDHYTLPHTYIHTYIHLLNGLFSHGGREKYPPAALNWVLAAPNLIHTLFVEAGYVGAT